MMVALSKLSNFNEFDEGVVVAILFTHFIEKSNLFENSSAGEEAAAVLITFSALRFGTTASPP